MTTRREFTQGSLAALLAAFVATLRTTTQATPELEPVAFDPRHHEALAIVTVTSAGLRSEAGELQPVLRFLLFDEPLAPEHEWMRDRCRQQLYAVLHKLEA